MNKLFVARLAAALREAGFETSTTEGTLTVAGCDFRTHNNRRQTRVHFIGSWFKVTLEGRFDEKRAVRRLIQNLPYRLSQKNEVDKRAFWRKSAADFGRGRSWVGVTPAEDGLRIQWPSSTDPTKLSKLLSMFAYALKDERAEVLLGVVVHDAATAAALLDFFEENM